MAFTVLSNAPSAGYIAWTDLHIQFAGTSYAIQDGNTNRVYAYWTLLSPYSLAVSDSFPTLTANDCLVFLNKSGVATVVPNATVLSGDLIVPGTILASALAANSVTADKILAGAVGATAIAANAVGAGAIAAGAVTAEKIDVADLFANSAFLQKLQVGSVFSNSIPPSNPAVGQLWRNTGVTPNELLAWTGKGTSSARRYIASVSGAIATIEDLSDSDDRALAVAVKTTANQAGSGTPSPTNIRAINPAITAGGNANVKWCGKNLFDTNGWYDWLSTFDITRHNRQVVDGIHCIWYAPDYTYNRQWMLGKFKPNTQYTMKCRVKGIVGTDVSTGFMFTYTDGSISYDFVPNASEWSDYLCVSEAGKTISHLRMGYNYNQGAYFDENSILLVEGAYTLATAPAYEPYAGNDYALSVQNAMYGVSGAEDERGSDGHETHKTAIGTLTGNENWYASAGWSNNCFYSDNAIPGSESIAGYDAVASMVCSHFPTDTPARIALTAGVSGVGVSSQTMFLGFGSDTATVPFQDVAALKVWLANQSAAGTPVQFVYRLGESTIVTNAATPITGADGANTILSDGTPLTVTYTGSGWAAVGGVQRLGVESVSITPEEGLRVDTVLQSADGAHQVSTFFNAQGSRYGLFRSSDGEMILGGMVLPSGQSAGVAGALVEPGSSGESRIEIKTSSDGTGEARVDTAALRLVQPGFAGATDSNPSSTGEKVPFWIESTRNTVRGANLEYADNFNASVKALDALRLTAIGDDGGELAWLLIQRAAGASLVYAGGAYDAADPERTLSNFAPMTHLSMPTGESIVFSATARRYMLDWRTIEDEYGKFATFKGGSGSSRDVGIVIQVSGYYRFVFHADFELASSSSGAVLHINRMPSEWAPPTTRDYCTDADLTPSAGPARLAYRRSVAAPLNAVSTTCELVADLWCVSGDKILPVAAMASASKTLVSAGTFFTAQKIG